MRRSSWTVLAVIVVLLGCLGFAYIRSLETTAPPMTNEVAEQFLNQGKSALERTNTESILALTTDNAKILGMKKDQARLALNQAMRNLSKSTLDIHWSNVNITPAGDTAFVTFDFDLGEKENNSINKLLSNHRVSLKLEKTATPHLFGLYTTQEWKASDVSSDFSLDGTVE